jgi:hypothetical protein
MLETLSNSVAYVGMGLVLVAFVLETRGKISSRGSAYLGLMIAGSGLLALRAAYAQEWAFLILEVVWLAAAVWALFGRRPATQSRSETS